MTRASDRRQYAASTSSISRPWCGLHLDGDTHRRAQPLLNHHHCSVCVCVCVQQSKTHCSHINSSEQTDLPIHVGAYTRLLYTQPAFLNGLMKPETRTTPLIQSPLWANSGVDMGWRHIPTTVQVLFLNLFFICFCQYPPIEKKNAISQLTQRHPLLVSRKLGKDQY